ncbi:magnesium-transporting ATPase [Salinibacterium xinjiangense]|uniref:Cation-transporting ATPase E n=1 Tax=Salinibacterium xinjiangense TaxID=386302 RepID=A0A2C8Z6N9_9MICO|nr:HAD-IC family P-type ATPase [Salinibacterium xinjiangense]GGK92395.1 magnesium-transporting ATPase [Salinibacterium xinjiangense]SOE59520.1 cation-transporting ATPase E [Salinibacterium xinjiangense]
MIPRQAEVTGLPRDAVAERVARGLTNTPSTLSSRSGWGILRDNVFTLFNGIVAGCFILLLTLGQWQDALFGFAAVGNSVIGVVQEYRAKRSLDKFAVLNSPLARVLREDGVTDIQVADIVMDDILVLRAGDQVGADAHVLSSDGLQLDESLLTGESDPVDRAAGSEILAGSSVVSGHGRARVTHVGADTFVSRLTVEAKRFSLVRSEIRGGLNRILRWISWALLPVMLIVVNGQMQVLGGWETAIRTGSWRMGAVGAVAAVIAMIPLGLVLLTSVAFAVAGVRLARQKVLVRELAAVEGLARVDMLCLDKTGTLTEGTISFDDVHVVSERQPAGWRNALGWFGSEPNANATARCLTVAFPDRAELAPVSTVPFSSTRKWSAVDFGSAGDAAGTWILGAPEFVLAVDETETLSRAAALAAEGKRTLVLACAPTRLVEEQPGKAQLPPGIRPVVLLTFREQVRPDARQTMRYFHEQGVQVRIISGDDPRTVAAVATQVGLGPVEGFDARDLPENLQELGDALETHTVFGRVTPAQKRQMILAMQSRGHVVAMTGDGVNDVLALKVADIGIAMNNATQATRAVSRLVLLDDRFDRLPSVVAEGRRAIANIERVSMLFLAKTVYAVVISVIFGALLWGFPFLPRQLSVIDGVTIGIPAFFLALMANNRRYRSGFLRRSLSFAIPAGIIVATAIAAVHVYGDTTRGLTVGGLRTASLITLALAALWILVIISRPLSPRRLLIIGVMYVGVALVFTVPISTEFLSLDMPPTPLLAATAGCVLGATIALEILYRVRRDPLPR